MIASASETGVSGRRVSASILDLQGGGSGLNAKAFGGLTRHSKRKSRDHRLVPS
jgi:hypothetical protein